jgi:exodeoxyribonuclease VIII
MIDYFDRPEISNSKLSWFKKSPAHFKFFQDNKTPDKPSYLVGSASHCILFEPELFSKVFHVLNENNRPNPDSDYKNVANRTWLKEQKEAYAHKKIISTSDYDMVMFMMDKMKEHEFVQELLLDCKFEQDVYWKDPNTGLECKKKVDGENSNHRIDYKTTDNADPIAWQKKTWSYDYYRQAGFYDLDVPKEFYFIVQEKTAPYGISVHKATESLLNYGKDDAIGLLRKIKVHMDHDIWPGYESKVFKPELEIGDRGTQYFDLDLPSWVVQSM